MRNSANGEEKAYQRFQTNLKELLRDHHVKQKEISFALKIPRTTLWSFCNGASYIPQVVRQEIANYLDIAPDSIWCKEEETQEDGQEQKGSPNSTLLESSFPQIQEQAAIGDPMNPTRRRLLQTGGYLTTSSLYWPPLWERLLYAIKQSSVDETLLTQIESWTRQCWQFQPDLAGLVSPELQAYILKHLQKVISLFSNSLLPTERKRLLTCASSLAQVAGIISFDLHHHEDAERYYMVSEVAAREAEQVGLQAVTLGRKSLLPRRGSLTWAREAVSLVASKREYGVTANWLWARVAELLAKQVQQGKTDALHEYSQAIEKASRETSSGNERVDPYFTCYDQRMELGYMGACSLAVGHFQKAENYLQQALSTGDQALLYHHGVFFVDMACARAGQGDLEGAYAWSEQALTAIFQTHSSAIYHRLRAVRDRTFSRWEEEKLVRELDRGLEDLERYFLNMPSSLFHGSPI